jgi:hypothetical protein
MPGDSGVLVVTRVRSTNTSAHEAAGAAGTRIPHALCFQGERFINGSGVSRGETAKSCLKFVSLFEKFEVGVGAKRSLTARHKTHLSCPDLIRASIHLRNMLFSKKMDHRVKPGDDDLNWISNWYNAP